MRQTAFAASAAYEALRVVKAAPGTLYGFFGYTTLTSGQWIQVHDSATVPADTAVPKIILWIPANGNFSADFGEYGIPFANGIVLCNSTTGPTKTLGATNTWFNGQYK